MSQEHKKKYFPDPPRKPRYYPFYKTKDCDDCLRKTFTIASYAGAAGVTVALLAGYSASTPDNPALYSNILMRLPKYGLPMAGAGALFASGVCVSAILRKKDGPLNHFFGGLAAGSAFGVAAKNQKVGWFLGFGFGIVAALWKIGKIEGWANPDIYDNQHKNSFNNYRRAYLTTRPNPEGNPDI